MGRLIDADALIEGRVSNDPVVIAAKCEPTVDAQPVVHGEWLLKAHKEDYCHWIVTAECSECHDEVKKIWGGNFPGLHDCMAERIALHSAKRVKLSNYCPNCGAKMDQEEKSHD